MKITKHNKLNGLRNEGVVAQSVLDRAGARRKNRGNGGTADWESCDSELIARLIAVIGLNKGTITFGYTRDGETYFISYYFGDKSEKFYCRPSEGIDTFLEYEIKAFEA